MPLGMDAIPHPELLHTLPALTAISVASLLGSVTFALGKRLQSALPYLVAIAGGTLLGTAVTHLLPEAIEHLKSVRRVSFLLLLRLLGSFLLERLLSLVFNRSSADARVSEESGNGDHFHHTHEHELQSRRPLAANILFSGAVHSFVDGVAIAVAFAVSHHVGIATTIAVFLHEVPHHIADVGVLIYSGMARNRAALLNLLATSRYAIGGVLVLISGLKSAAFTFTVLPIAAANFLYIGLVILVPELHRERNGPAIPGASDRFYHGGLVDDDCELLEA
jgi:zinc and cadmium transporter